MAALWLAIFPSVNQARALCGGDGVELGAVAALKELYGDICVGECEWGSMRGVRDEGVLVCVCVFIMPR